MVTLNRNVTLIFVIVLFIQFGGCANERELPTPDKNGDLPGDCVQLFLKTIEDDNYSLGRSLWIGSSKSIAPLDYETEFCAQFKRAKKIAVGEPTKDKGPYWSVKIDFVEGEVVTRSFWMHLMKIDSEWKLVRSLLW